MAYGKGSVGWNTEVSGRNVMGVEGDNWKAKENLRRYSEAEIRRFDIN